MKTCNHNIGFEGGGSLDAAFSAAFNESRIRCARGYLNSHEPWWRDYSNVWFWIDGADVYGNARVCTGHGRGGEGGA
jgi:hypothetical protein